ncbi:DEAD/DEAH box helicase family protein [bacterium]
MDTDKRISEIQNRIKEIESERKQLLIELDTLQRNNDKTSSELHGTPVASTIPESTEEKIDLFMRLFCCRTDVFPKYWENRKKGTKGYSPVCSKEWQSGICNKSKIKCSECMNKSFIPLDASIIKAHFSGKLTIGTYAIQKDDTCIFLAADFDKSSWKEDTLAYKKAANDMRIPVYVERSKSGNGAHIWLFFNEPVLARLARQLGTIILSRALMKRSEISLESYDRFFPNQDLVPKGGFGNLIALPLQKEPGSQGNSLFIDDSLNTISDQWEYMSQFLQLSKIDVNNLIDKYYSYDKKPYLLQDEDVIVAEQSMSINSKDLTDCYHNNITFNLNSGITIDIQNLPSRLITAFKRTAVFANPKYFEMQRLRFSTWKIPKYIFCGELLGSNLILPRGVILQCQDIVNLVGAKSTIRDQQIKLDAIEFKFIGKLSTEQKRCVNEIIKHELGVMVAPTGSGKTVMACYIIAERKVPTLILVHRKQLIDQWIDHICSFLDVDKKEIGVYGGGRKKLKGKIDISMLQTLSKMNDLSDITNKYEQIIIDECHHIPAFSFESVLNRFPARCFLGLTATPYRKDGHQPIIFMQCGPIHYEMKEINDADTTRKVIIRETEFRLPIDSDPQPPIHEIWNQLVEDKKRVEQIACDIIETLKADRFPLILSERKEYLISIEKIMNEMSEGLNFKGVLLLGEMGKKARKTAIEEIHRLIMEKSPVYILSTGSLIGEGFDLPKLDTLILAMPISFKGRVIQYAGRIHRKNDSKTEVHIYDYVDTSLGLTISMFKKRIKAYKKMGYVFDLPNNRKIEQWVQGSRVLRNLPYQLFEES